MPSEYNQNNENTFDELSDSVHQTTQSIHDAKEFARCISNVSNNVNNNASFESVNSINASSFANNVNTSNIINTASNFTVGASSASTAATAVKAGTASGGVGAVVVLALSVIRSGIDRAKKDEAEIIGETPDHSSGCAAPFLFLLCLCLLITASIIVAPAIVIYNQIVKPVSISYETTVYQIESYFEEHRKEQFFEDLFGKDYDAISVSPRQLNEETLEVYKDIIDYSIERAFDQYVWELILNLDTWKKFFFDGYNPYATYQNFLSQPYPYTLVPTNGQVITIGDYLNNPNEIDNNDLNYAEIFAILCQNENNSYLNFTYSDFYDLMINKDTTTLLFEMEVNEIHYYKYDNNESYDVLKDSLLDEENKSPILSSLNDINIHEEFSENDMNTYINHLLSDSDNPDSNENWWNNIKDAWDSFWNSSTALSEEILNKLSLWKTHFFFSYEVKVKPYGLEEMYSLAGIPYNAANYNIPQLSNYELLDYQEQWIRTLVPGIFLGPSYDSIRSTRSLIYTDIQNSLYSSSERYIQPTGRSLMSYVDESLVNQVLLGNNYYQEWNTSRVHYDINFNPNGESVVLDMFSYINQGDYPNDKRGPFASSPDTRDSIKKSGCIDCVYIMLYEYYSRSTLNVPSICLNYVRDNNFLTGDFLHDYNMTGSTNIMYSESRVIQELTQGKPVILYIQGGWTYSGITYHSSSNGHFLLLVGFDETGFFVYDPGSRTNTTRGSIPYEAFQRISNKFIRTITPNGSYDVFYRYNSITGDFNES